MSIVIQSLRPANTYDRAKFLRLVDDGEAARAAQSFAGSDLRDARFALTEAEAHLLRVATSAYGRYAESDAELIENVLQGTPADWARANVPPTFIYPVFEAREKLANVQRRHAAAVAAAAPKQRLAARLKEYVGAL